MDNYIEILGNLIDYDSYKKSRDQYVEHLTEHRNNVVKAWNIIKLVDIPFKYDKKIVANLIYSHDVSKHGKYEFDYYRQWNYPATADEGNRSVFNKGFLHHLHNNPHHWQHWTVLTEQNILTPIDIPNEYILEMISDWLSFSINENNINDLEKWYNNKRVDIKFTQVTRDKVESLINKIIAYNKENNII